MKHILVSIILLFVSSSYALADGIILRDTVSLSPSCRLKYDLLNSETFRYHPVNGVDFQESATLFYNPDSASVFSSSVRLQYATLPHIFEPELALSYAYDNRHTFSLVAGRELHDWKQDPNTEMRWIKNTFSALFAHKNYKIVIDKKYFTSSYTFKPTPKSLVKISYDRYDITPMRNHSTFSIVRNGDDFKANTPQNNHVDSAQVLNKRSGVSAITLASEFPICNNQHSPLLGIDLRYINHVKVFHPQISLSQSVSYSKVYMTHWEINGGLFSGGDSKSLSFHEWYHIQSSRKLLPTRDKLTGVVGLVSQHPYSFSTNDWHIDASLRLFRPRVILLQIPVLNQFFLGESITLTTIYTKQNNKLYSEIGYELLNVLDSFHLGVFCSFNGKEYNETNIRLGVVPKNIWKRKK
ncbi:MAG: DUF5686 family protein [Bacteroidia bacterium]|nr:DUF5686 family protein [Bacteroidia bacterium]